MEFDINKYQYLSYMKVLSRISKIKPAYLSHGIEASARTTGKFGTTLRNTLDAGIEAEINTNYSIKGDGSQFDSKSKIDVRSAAPSVLRDISKDAQIIDSNAIVEAGEWFEYRGKVRFGIRYHDNFRDDIDNAPKLAFWSFIIQNPGEATVTLYALTGTVDGNLVDFDLGNLPTSRAGSDTMSYFNSRFKEENALSSGEDDSQFMQPHWIALHTLGTLSNLMETEIMNLEILFQVKKILDLDLEGEKSVETTWDIEMNESSSYINAKKITKIVVGSPICTQKFTPKNQTNLPVENLSFFGRMKKYFGF